MQLLMGFYNNKVQQILLNFFRQFQQSVKTREISFRSQSLHTLRATSFQDLSIFQDGGHVKFPTLGHSIAVKILIHGAVTLSIPVVCPPPTPPGLNIDS